MGWNDKMEKVKTTGIYYPCEGDSDEPLLDFNIENFNNHKFHIDGYSLKFVQVYVNNKPYMRIGCTYHKHMLENLLKEFNLNFNKIINKRHDEIPAVKDKNYEFVGAGMIKPDNGNFIFYDFSSDYIEFIKGTDGKNLEDIFGRDNVKEIEGKHREPSFAVKI